MVVFSETSSDPRIRRTRRLLQDALPPLLEKKAFSDISITDICRQADIARVTFYQHYDSKEALLLAGVTDFFASFHQTLDIDAIDQYLRTGEANVQTPVQPMALVDPNQIKLVGVALANIGSAVRKLSIPSFQQALSERETELNEKQIEVIATFYIGGILTLLEQFLNGQLTLSTTEFQATTLPLLRALRQSMLDAPIG